MCQSSMYKLSGFFLICRGHFVHSLQHTYIQASAEIFDRRLGTFSYTSYSGAKMPSLLNHKCVHVLFLGLQLLHYSGQQFKSVNTKDTILADHVCMGTMHIVYMAK